MATTDARDMQDFIIIEDEDLEEYDSDIITPPPEVLLEIKK
jgi:hypothetical protein